MAENTKLGELLDEHYGQDHQIDRHISHFYLILGGNLVKKREVIVTQLQELGEGKWGNLETEWPEFIVGEFPQKADLPDETERQREERLNATLRLPLRQLLHSQDPQNPPQIIISRVCKYTREIGTNLHTHRIETILTSPIPNNFHLDYFYLFIKPQITTHDIPTLLKLLPGKWKKVEPEGIWPQTFLGYFPKEPFESEREREWRLNKEVRMPLKENLKGVQKVAVLFTRACKYTNM